MNHKHCIPKDLLIDALNKLKYKAKELDQLSQRYAMSRNMDAACSYSDSSKMLYSAVKFIEQSCIEREK